MVTPLLAILVQLSSLHIGASAWVDWQSLGAIPDSQVAAANNTASLNAALASLWPGDTLYIANRTFWMAGGVQAIGIASLTLHLDGTLRFLPGRTGWPVHESAWCQKWWNPVQPAPGKECVAEAIFLANVRGLTLTSNGTGTLYGSGEAWWGYLRYLIHRENRPRLFSLVNATDVLVENWSFLQARPSNSSHVVVMVAVLVMW